MPVVPLMIYLIKKIKCIFYDICFICFQKPFLLLNKQNKITIKGKLRKCVVSVMGNNNCVYIEKGCCLYKTEIEITGKNNTLILHKGVRMVEGGRIRIEDKDNLVEVGEDTQLINVFLSSCDVGTKLSIGKNSLFSSDVIVRTSDSHSIIDENGMRINNGADVYIGDHVWICNGARILKGSSIGSNSIVGSNSLVAGQTIQDNELAVGNPSRVVKRNVNWSQRRI